jgi:phage FluMu protein Com
MPRCTTCGKVIPGTAAEEGDDLREKLAANLRKVAAGHGGVLIVERLCPECEELEEWLTGDAEERARLEARWQRAQGSRAASD